MPLDSHHSDELDVLVVGAGPAGLSVAKALQNRGIQPDIIEKDSEIRSDGAGIAIPANATWALSKLGIDLDSKAMIIPKMCFTDHSGNLLVEEEIDRIHPEGSQFYSLSREALIEKLKNEIQAQTSLTVKSFSEENDRVKVSFSNGVVKDYDFVIGCDGVHSSLRTQTHPEEVSEFLGLLVWRTLIDSPERVTMPTYMLGPDRLVLLYPMPNQKLYVYGHQFQTVKSPPEDSFSNTFSSFGGQVPEVISRLDGAKFHIHHMEKSHSVRFKLEGFSRVLLVGDASHAFGPMLQNGAAQAFEDAYVLQDLLSVSFEKRQIPDLIDAFEKRRKARVERVFAFSNAKIQAISNPEQIKERNAAIRMNGAPNVHGFKLIMQDNP